MVMEKREICGNCADYPNLLKCIYSTILADWKMLLEDLTGLCTSKVGSVGELHLLVELCDNTGHTVLDEVHLLSDRPLTDDVIIGLEDLKLQLAQHTCHKVRVCIGKQGHCSHQFTAIEVDDFLKKKGEMR